MNADEFADAVEELCNTKSKEVIEEAKMLEKAGVDVGSDYQTSHLLVALLCSQVLFKMALLEITTSLEVGTLAERDAAMLEHIVTVILKQRGEHNEEVTKSMKELLAFVVCKVEKDRKG